MGYNTRYEIRRVDGDVEKFRAAFNTVDGGYHWFGIAVGSERTKWYEHEKQIVAAVLASQVSLVVLYGEGEDTGDAWEKHFKYIVGEDQVSVVEYRYKLVRDEGGPVKRFTRAGEVL